MFEIRQEVKLSSFTTFGIGGPADFLITVTTRDELVDALNWAKEKHIPFTVIGYGSNVLFSDSGFRGLVIINRADSFEIHKDSPFKSPFKRTVLKADSGANLGKMARETLEHGYIGLHFGAGIPGSIGGAIVGNAGALDGDISKTLISAEIWHDGEITKWQNSDFEFDYRNSKLKGSSGKVILGAEFSLVRADTTEILKLILEDKQRRNKRYTGKTCGSYFKNPGNKIAGQLIDNLGLKGHRVGSAEISFMHANVIRNIGNATAKDVTTLEKFIIDKVHNKYGIKLEPEIVKIGF